MVSGNSEWHFGRGEKRVNRLTILHVVLLCRVTVSVDYLLWSHNGGGEFWISPEEDSVGWGLSLFLASAYKYKHKKGHVGLCGRAVQKSDEIQNSPPPLLTGSASSDWDIKTKPV